MSTSVSEGRFAEDSPLRKARAAGALWLTVIAASVVAVVLQSKLFVRGDAALTANNIIASESLFRLSVAVDLFAGACYLGVTVLLYGLLKPAGRGLSLFAAFAGLAGLAVGAAAALLRLAPLVLLGGGQDAAAFTAAQAQALAMTALRLEGFGFNVAMVYFGLQCVSVGWLIVRSTFLPRALGVLLAAGGASYVLGSFTNFLSPTAGALVFPLIVPIAIVGEGALTLWLLFKGVNVERWEESSRR
jgi:hypothetical protein